MIFRLSNKYNPYNGLVNGDLIYKENISAGESLIRHSISSSEENGEKITKENIINLNQDIFVNVGFFQRYDGLIPLLSHSKITINIDGNIRNFIVERDERGNRRLKGIVSIFEIYDSNVSNNLFNKERPFVLREKSVSWEEIYKISKLLEEGGFLKENWKNNKKALKNRLFEEYGKSTLSIDNIHILMEYLVESIDKKKIYTEEFHNILENVGISSRFHIQKILAGKETFQKYLLYDIVLDDSFLINARNFSEGNWESHINKQNQIIDGFRIDYKNARKNHDKNDMELISELAKKYVKMEELSDVHREFFEFSSLSIKTGLVNYTMVGVDNLGNGIIRENLGRNMMQSGDLYKNHFVGKPTDNLAILSDIEKDKNNMKDRLIKYINRNPSFLNNEKKAYKLAFNDENHSRFFSNILTVIEDLKADERAKILSEVSDHGFILDTTMHQDRIKGVRNSVFFNLKWDKDSIKNTYFIVESVPFPYLKQKNTLEEDGLEVAVTNLVASISQYSKESNELLDMQRGVSFSSVFKIHGKLSLLMDKINQSALKGHDISEYLDGDKFSIATLLEAIKEETHKNLPQSQNLVSANDSIKDVNTLLFKKLKDFKKTLHDASNVNNGGDVQKVLTSDDYRMFYDLGRFAFCAKYIGNKYQEEFIFNKTDKGDENEKFKVLRHGISKGIDSIKGLNVDDKIKKEVTDLLVRIDHQKEYINKMIQKQKLQDPIINLIGEVSGGLNMSRLAQGNKKNVVLFRSKWAVNKSFGVVSPIFSQRKIEERNRSVVDLKLALEQMQKQVHNYILSYKDSVGIDETRVQERRVDDQKVSDVGSREKEQTIVETDYEREISVDEIMEGKGIAFTPEIKRVVLSEQDNTIQTNDYPNFDIMSKRTKEAIGDEVAVVTDEMRNGKLPKESKDLKKESIVKTDSAPKPR